MISERARPLVRAALEARLGKLPERKDAPAERAPASDPEEALRKLMVVWYPRLVLAVADGSGITGTALEEFSSLVLSLESAAKTEDIRSLDAWNHVYETYEIVSPRAENLKPEWRAILAAYRRILEAQVARLA